MKDLLVSWRWIARTANVANLRATDNLSWRNFALGGASATLGAIVGLGIFATLQEGTAHLWIRLTASGVAFLAAGLAALWKYLNYGPRVEEHRKASREYGNLVRLIDLELERDPAVTDAVAAQIRTTMDAIDTSAPNVSPLVWAWAAEGVAAERDAEGKGEPPVDASLINRGMASRLQRVWDRLFK
jgi:hypothetical protein